MSVLEITAIVGVVTVAACVQGSVGFGVALIASPILVLIDPSLVPGPMIASSLVLSLLIAIRERAHFDFTRIRFSMVGNVAGAIAGAAVLATLDAQGFAILFGLLVLLAVVSSALGLHVPLNRVSALGAGLLGGFMNATASIGGPPMALVYQHEDANRFRGTLSVYFVVSCAVSLTALGLAGLFGRRELEHAALLVPGQVAGFALSGFTNRVLRGLSLRPFILGLSAVSALGVLAGAFL